MKPEMAAKQRDDFLVKAPAGGGPRFRKRTCISSCWIPEVDAVTGEWPEPWATRVAEHERRRNNFDKLCADGTRGCGRCGGGAYNREGPRRADLYDVNCCTEVDVFDLR